MKVNSKINVKVTTYMRIMGKGAKRLPFLVPVREPSVLSNKKYRPLNIRYVTLYYESVLASHCCTPIFLGYTPIFAPIF